ncbi:MAG TPA: metalloregulator ArsR/SmtB family transcription factor, partial [Syntrophorhabdaceae bacterium]|nr:metalloregulator ArsR/SmtB family transcription factor [Syntrophorhabdaceae bacterium]
TSRFKALSDETRLRILKLLEHGELCVCDVVAALDMAQPQVSFHLRILKECGILKSRKDGKWMHYQIDEKDIFNRVLVLSIFERMPNGLLKEDTRRLNEFLKLKAEGSIDGTAVCKTCVKRAKEIRNERHP